MYVNWLHHNEAVMLHLKPYRDDPPDRFVFTPEPGNEWEIMDVHQSIYYEEHYDFECCRHRNFTAMYFEMSLKRNAGLICLSLNTDIFQTSELSKLIYYIIFQYF